MGDMKQTVLIPFSYTCRMASIRDAIVEALSMSARNFSSRVLIDHETVTLENLFNKSMSRNTKSDFVHIIISALLP